MIHFERAKSLGWFGKLQRWWYRPDAELEKITKYAGSDERIRELKRSYQDLTYDRENMKVVNAVIKLWAHRAEGYLKFSCGKPEFLHSDKGEELHRKLQKLTTERVKALGQGDETDLRAVRLLQKTLQSTVAMLRAVSSEQKITIQGAISSSETDVASLIEGGYFQGVASLQDPQGAYSLAGLFTTKQFCLHDGKCAFNTTESIHTLDELVLSSAQRDLKEKLQHKHLDTLLMSLRERMDTNREEIIQEIANEKYGGDVTRVDIYGDDGEQIYDKQQAVQKDFFTQLIKEKTSELHRELQGVFTQEYLKKQLLGALQGYSEAKRKAAFEVFRKAEDEQGDLTHRKEVLEALIANFEAHKSYAQAVLKLAEGREVPGFDPQQAPEFIHGYAVYTEVVGAEAQEQDKVDECASLERDICLEEADAGAGIGDDDEAAGAAVADGRRRPVQVMRLHDLKETYERMFSVGAYRARLESRVKDARRGYGVVQVAEKMVRLVQEKAFRGQAAEEAVNGAGFERIRGAIQEEYGPRVAQIAQRVVQLQLKLVQAIEEERKFEEGRLFSISFSDEQREQIKREMNTYLIHFNALQNKAQALLAGPNPRNPLQGTVLHRLQAETDLRRDKRIEMMECGAIRDLSNQALEHLLVHLLVEAELSEDVRLQAGRKIDRECDQDLRVYQKTARLALQRYQRNIKAAQRRYQVEMDRVVQVEQPSDTSSDDDDDTSGSRSASSARRVDRLEWARRRVRRLVPFTGGAASSSAAAAAVAAAFLAPSASPSSGSSERRIREPLLGGARAVAAAAEVSSLLERKQQQSQSKRQSVETRSPGGRDPVRAQRRGAQPHDPHVAGAAQARLRRRLKRRQEPKTPSHHTPEHHTAEWLKEKGPAISRYARPTDKREQAVAAAAAAAAGDRSGVHSWSSDSE